MDGGAGKLDPEVIGKPGLSCCGARPRLVELPGYYQNLEMKLSRLLELNLDPDF